MTTTIRSLSLFLYVALVFGLTGCESESTLENPSDQNSSDTVARLNDDHDHGDHDHDDHDHDDHDHGHEDHGHGHHHHHDSLLDFPHAMEHLVEGHEQLQEAVVAGQIDEKVDQLLHEQQDLANRLPESAADSDMPEAPWNQVNTLAVQLANAYESVIADYDASETIEAGSLKAAQDALEALQRLEEEADPSWFPDQTER